MGRLLDIAQAVPRMNEQQEVSQESLREKREKVRLPKSGWNQAAADVLNILVSAGKPLPLSALVQQMTERGHPKKKARAEVLSCQWRGWIEHNLVSGYILSGMAAGEKEEDVE